jgi:purine-binding chemotaxis protein CheW
MTAEAESYVLFELAESVYALPSRNVLHIEMVEHISLVPNANPAIDGVVFSRGQVFPALNLRARFGFKRQANTPRSRVIFTKIHERTVGLIVDTAREFRTFPADGIKPIEETLTGIHRKYLKAVIKSGDRAILVPDLEVILNVEDLELPPAAVPSKTKHGKKNLNQ